MAWIGPGSGTIGDPYQILTTQHLYEFSVNGYQYSASDYFLVMNDINDVSTFIGISLNANFNGGGHTITIPGDRYNAYSLPTVNFTKPNIKFEDCKFIFNDVIASTPIQQQSSYSNITLKNLSFIFNATFREIDDQSSISGVFGFDCPSTWHMSDLYFEGPFPRVFQNINSSLNNIEVVLTRAIRSSQGVLCGNIMGNNVYLKNCRVKFSSAWLQQAGVLAYNANGVGTTIEECYVTGELKGTACAPFIYITRPDTILRNNYFNGNLIDYSDWGANGIYGIAADYDASLINNYAYVNSYKKQLCHIYDSSNYFDNLGFNDWHIPSKDELWTVLTNGGPTGPNLYPGGYTYGYMTSSEVNSTTYHTYYYGGFQPKTKVAANEYGCFLPVREFTYTPDNEPAVGQRYMGGKCVYKDASLMKGLMVSNWVAEGAKIYNYGSTGTLLNTSTGMFTGKTNTQLMIAAATSPQSVTRWNGSYSYPTFPNISSYMIFPSTNAAQQNNYTHFKSKESFLSIQSFNYLGVDLQKLVTDASIRNINTFTNWDFTNIWHQVAPNRLPTLRNLEEDQFVGIGSVTKDSSTKFSLIINSFSDLTPEGSIGLKIFNNGSEIYDVSGLTHIVNLSDDSDRRLTFKPYYNYNGVKNIILDRDYYFRPYDKKLYYNSIPIQSSFVFNAATVGMDIKLIHGSLFYNGYIYGCSRQTATVVKVKASDYSQRSYVNIAGWGSGFDQIILCNGFIWGLRATEIVRIDPSTMTYKKASLGSFTTHGSEPLACSHDRFLYVPGVQYTYKYDSNYFLGTDISTNCPDSSIGNALVGTYDSFVQGQWLTYKDTYPLYTGSVKGACHSACCDGEHLYIAYTTDYNIGTFNKISGWIPSIGVSCHELHKVRVSDMTPVAYVVIPQCTDDMDQDTDFVYLGCEVQYTADPSVYGRGCSVLSVKKSDMSVHLVPNSETGAQLPPMQQSYGVHRMGKYLVDQRTSNMLQIVEVSDPGAWSMNLPWYRDLRNYSGFIGNPGGAPNELVMDTSGNLHAFGWVVAGGAPYPSSLMKYRVPTDTPLVGPPIVKTLDASAII